MNDSTTQDCLPRDDQWCVTCERITDHLLCWDTDLDLVTVSSLIALHDVALAAEYAERT